MSDPLSVAGTAVGITSLGIQVCQGLISYLRSIKGKNEEISDGLRDIQNVVAIFYSLNALLPKIDQQKCTASTAIRRCLKESEDQLHDLQNLLIKLGAPQNSTSVKGKMREVGCSIIYPFHEGKLKSLRDTLQRLLHNLNLAIGVASLESEAVHHDRIEHIGSTIETIQANSQAQNDGINTLHTRMERNLEQLRAMEDKITSAFREISQQLKQTEWVVRDLDQNITGKLSLIQTDTRATALSSQVTAEKLDQLLQMTESNREWISRMAMQISHVQANPSPQPQGHLNFQPKNGSSSPLPSPISLDAASGLTELKRKAPSRGTLSILAEVVCTCPLETVSSTLSYSMWNFKIQFEQQQPQKHRPECKFYGINPKTNRTVKGQFPLKMLWFSSRISLACFEISTGTSSPGISVRYNNIVPESCSPVYKELQSLKTSVEDAESPTELIKLLQSTERTILTLYRDGKAAPNDRDERGRSNTRMIVDAFTGFAGHPELPLVSEHEELVTHAVIRFLRTFIALVKQDDAQLDIGFALGAISPPAELGVQPHNRAWIEFLMNEFECTLRLNIIVLELHILRDVPDLVDIMDIGRLERAIVSQSLHDLETCIARDPKVVMTMPEGLTTLYLCATWPQGLQRLLMTEARTLINYGGLRTAILQAIEWGCPESVDLLMSAGCDLHLHCWKYSDKPRPYSRHLENHDVIEMLAIKLAQRRRELLKLAKRELGVMESPDSSYVADGEAAYLCKALADAGISVAPALLVDCCYKTLFHSPDIPLAYFSKFFEQGFRNHRCHNSLGLTPIMVKRSIYMDESRGWRARLWWLQREGFLDLTPKDPLGIGLNTSATGWHYLAVFLSSDFESDADDRDRSVFDTGTRAISRVTIRDHCDCWCSSGEKGCLPLMILWKGLAESDETPLRLDSGYLMHTLFHHDKGGAISGAKEPPVWLSELVRFLTFEALEMTHTCCVSGRVPLPPHLIHTCCSSATALPGTLTSHDEEISPPLILGCGPERFQEIRSDKMEQQDAHLLDVLMEDFNDQMRSLHPSPWMYEKFISGYWRESISRLFSVNKHEVGQMRRHVCDIETHVLPRRVQNLVGEAFELFRYGSDEDEEDEVDDERAESDESDENEDTSECNEQFWFDHYNACPWCKNRDEEEDSNEE
ncbi:hypothetical protein EDB81DRAFT_779069 [Dactylonectria macrodidyma]|uniref:Fungal N-terminal domain-containing protein n=1 Tax=Dactylonectria macrodidyma TaxID=307937 RepID=A0A9P9JM93_9HYPO|nr:hypothetical protein EDB81DRAFT_779069 [Dactylonectria macrodidyma]